MKNVRALDPKDHILILGAKLHNLKNIDVAIQRNSLTVITGLSGSGKSSLAFDTLYAEGQRRYVESLSSYARQFMGRLNKPKVEQIKGIAPAIAVEQKVNSVNPRSTVGTKTEIYDYLKLLFARIGKTYSPTSNTLVKKDNVSDVVDTILSFEEGSKLLLLAPIENAQKRKPKELINILVQQGFARIYAEGKTLRIKEDMEDIPKTFDLIVERIVVKKDDEDFKNRLSDSVDVAFFEGKGRCSLVDLSTDKTHSSPMHLKQTGRCFWNRMYICLASTILLVPVRPVKDMAIS